VGEGSRFIVELPFALSTEIRKEEPRKKVASARTETHKVRLLLVEDNPVNQKVALAMLSKRGYPIDVANNGQEALDLLEKSPQAYNLVLMDVQMPVLDGLETTLAIRRDGRWARLPVIAMTAHAMTGDRERCLKAGMNDYLSKPLQSADLVAAIEKQLTQPLTQQPTQQMTQPLLAEPLAVSGSVEGVVSGAVTNALPEEQAVARSMLSLFVELAPERMNKVDAALQTHDPKTLAGEAKALRVAARQMGNVRIVAAAAQVEACASRGDFANAATHAATLREELDALAGALV
jgi:CheY-like chemotaxis protein/HPt (histidine-containing phosphotransfer) domain-containing protein